MKVQSVQASYRRMLLAMVAASLFFGLTILPSAAQVVHGTITGRVVDGGDSALPDVEVIVTNQSTGISVRTTTNGSGDFTVPELEPGTYTIAGNKAGFARQVTIDLPLLSQQTLRQNLKLKVGEVSETVQVEGRSALIDTENASITTPIKEVQLRELPTTIQDIDSFLVLAAGVGRATFNSSPQIAGSSHWGADNFTLNGVSVNDSGNGGGSYSFGLGGVNLPSLSSLQEVTVGGITMDARYSRIVDVQMVTKNGTNKFHGDAYEYIENTIFNANTFVSKAAGIPRSPFHRNEFGGDIGGPIFREKAFFFFDYDGVRQSVPQPIQVNLPSLAERKGDFGALCTTYTSAGLCTGTGGVQLYNPATGNPFAYNVIDPTLITSQAKALLAYMPSPTDPNSPGLPQGTTLGGVTEQYNYTSTIGQAFEVNKWDARLDYHITKKDTIFGVYSHSVGDPWFDPLGTPPTYGNGQNYGFKTYTLSGTEQHTFGSTAYNSLRGAWFDHESIRSGQNADFNPYTLFPQMTPSNNRGLPTMTMTGYNTLGDIGQASYVPEYDIEVTDDFTKVKGRHTIQAGFDETGFKISAPGHGYTPLGTWAFNGTWTGNRGWPSHPTSIGNTFADFLLGDAQSATTGSPAVDQVNYSRDWEFYGQDIWQATPTLTINYGLRYVYQTPWSSRNNVGSYFSFAANKLVLPEDSSTPTAPPGSVASLLTLYPFTTTGALGMPLTFYTPDQNNYAPRIGFAWRAFGTRTVLRGGYGLYYNFNAAYIGFSHNVQNAPWASNTTYTSKKPATPTSPFLPDISFSQPFPSSTAGSPAANPTIYAMPQNFKNAKIQQASLTVEQQFGTSWAMRMSYVLNRSVDLPFTQYNTNVPIVQNPTGTLQSERPYQPWGPIQTTNNDNISNTDQMQLEVQRRFAKGFYFQSQYSWTACRDEGPPTGSGPIVINDKRRDYGNCPYISRHTLVSNYIYDLPFGAGHRWLQSGILSAVAGGWSVSGITVFQTGPAFSVTFTSPSTYPGWIASRADIVPGVDPYLKSHAHASTATWLNPAAFVAPAPGQWGNSPRNGYFGPGYQNWDMSVKKKFVMPFDKSQQLQFGADFLNAFNHTNWDGGGTTIGGVAAPVIATVGTAQYGGAAVKNFGQVTSGEGSRIISLSARYSF